MGIFLVCQETGTRLGRVPFAPSLFQARQASRGYVNNRK
jgi:hypothetical protein